MYKCKVVTVLSTLLGLLYASSGNTVENKYITLEGGWAFPNKFKDPDGDGGDDDGGESYGHAPNSAAVYGVGVGVKLSEQWRFDFSASRVNSMKFHSQDVIPEPLLQAGADRERDQRISSSTFFANLHYSLPYALWQDYYLFPSISLSIGTAGNKAGDYVMKVANDAGDILTWTALGETKRSFAYGMGFGIDHNFENLELSFGYKFYHLGRFATSTTSVAATNAGVALVMNNSDPRESTLYLHTLMFGVRSYF